MGERTGDPNQPSDGTPADRPHHPQHRADGGAADHDTTGEPDRSPADGRAPSGLGRPLPVVQGRAAAAGDRGV